jgi:2-C-methyl-D-erythritol 4-phosphate cytidylyltransferase
MQKVQYRYSSMRNIGRLDMMNSKKESDVNESSPRVPKTIAIILSGGKGDRFGATVPKQFLSMNGRPILWHTVNKFLNHPRITETIIVSNPDWIDDTKTLFPDLRIVEGGETRQISSKNGILACPDDTKYVIIHDAVRPLVSAEVIDRCLDALDLGHVAVATVIPSADTLVIMEDSVIADIPERARIKRSQTPQAFHFEPLRKAHLTTKGINSTDDVRPVFEMGYECVAVDGDMLNMKVTTIADLYSIERLFQLIQPKILDSFDFTDKTAVVFGGTSGIGAATADLLEKSGAKVTRCGRKNCDVREEANVKRLFDSLGHIDIIVNSAGILIPQKLADTPSTVINDVIATNLIGPMNVCKLAVRYMTKGGHIVNVGSSSAYRGRAGYSIYSASKAALANFSQAVADEFVQYGICVNTVSPPRTNTRLYLNLYPEVDPSSLFDPKDAARVICSYCIGTETGNVVDLKLSMKSYGTGMDETSGEIK